MDRQVIDHFKNKRYASLEYLSNEDSWSQDENNLGLYFFLLDLKGLDISEIFGKILQKKKDEAAAYRYLGEVARKLFIDWYGPEIAAYYYKKALKYDGRDIDVLWSLFDLTYDTSYFLTAIRKDYELKNFERVSYSLRYVFPSHLIKSKFGKADWQELKEICLDDNVKNYHELLSICYFYLEEFENGIGIMDEMEKVSGWILDIYLNYGAIDPEYAIQKSSYSECDKYLKGDFKRIYEKVKEEAKKGQKNPSKAVIIESAFKAQEYHDVIKLVGEGCEERKPIGNQLMLYHILASLYLDIDINKEYERVVINQNFFNKPDYEVLYLAYFVLRNIKSLQNDLAKKAVSFPVRFMGLYSEAEKYLSCDSLLNHYLYDSLAAMLESLQYEWDIQAINNEIEELLNTDRELNEETKLNLAINYTNVESYGEAIALLTKMPPSISIFNLLGMNYEGKGELETAFTYYESAIKLMKSSGEINNQIIYNYLSCLGSLKKQIPASLHDEYIDDFNKSIASYFRYNPFIFRSIKKLFKYYPFNQFTLDALVNGYFYLASAEQLNDPIELPYKNLSAGQANVFLRPYFRVASFSSNENSMLMWSHYAENHTGLMVEYYFEGELPEGVGIEQVSYSHTIKRHNEKGRYLFNQYMLTKNEDWSYEKEVRLFAYKKEKVFYEKVSYPFKQNDKASAYIKNITVGYKFPESTIKLIQSMIRDLNDNRDENLPKIVLRRAKLSTENFFELEYEAIS